MFERIYQQQWISLPKEVRERLSKIFAIPQSGIIEVFNEKVISDGKTNEDLAVITKEKLVEYCKQDGTFADLFNIAAKKALWQANGMMIEQKSITSNLSKRLGGNCDTCDTKGIRHKKYCPKSK